MNEEEQPTRYITAVMARAVVDFVGSLTTGVGGDVADVLIVAFVGGRSTRAMIGDRYLAQRYGYEARVMPNEERKPTSIREICDGLNMKRETVRRRLVRLEAEGWLLKVEGGFIKPAQVGENDQTKALRQIVVKKANRLVRDLEKLRQH